MCHLITLIVRGGDATAIDAFMRERGRRAAVSANPSIQRVLGPGEVQFTTAAHCDCGTTLAPPRPSTEPGYAKQAEKLRKQGWSEAKIERALAEKQKNATRPKQVADDIGFWAGVIRDLPASTGAATAGLVLHYYSGRFDSEEFAVVREEVAVDALADRLATLREDVLLIARR
jgi:hypothetical protein